MGFRVGLGSVEGGLRVGFGRVGLWLAQGWLEWLRVGFGLLRLELLHAALVPKERSEYRKQVLFVKQRSP